MVDSPNDALQTYKVSGRKSPRGRVGEQKKYKIAKKIAGKIAKNRGKLQKKIAERCAKIEGKNRKKSRKSRENHGKGAKKAYLYISVIMDGTSPKLP